MTLVEFLAPLSSGTNQSRVIALLYFKERYEGIAALTVDQIRAGLVQARAPKARTVNIADVLNKAAHLVDSAGVAGTARLWRLTESGRDAVRKLLSLPDADAEIEHDVGALTTVAGKIADAHSKDYINEAIKCLQSGALRACVVFAWVGTIRVIQEELLAKYGSPAVTGAIKKHDSKGRTVSKIEDFAYVKDSIVLLAAKELGMFDKGEKDTLEEALDLRNRCGHPGQYRPGPKKVSSFIEDIVSVVY